MNKRKYKILYAGKYLRGFHKNLIENPPKGISYVFEDNTSQPKFFETKPWYIKVLLKLWHGKIGDILGLIFRAKIKKHNQVDAIQTYNRFITSNGIPYVIYLENPTAPYHYDLNRVHTTLGSLRLKKILNDPNLKAVICMSKACFNTVEKLVPDFQKSKYQIYPFIPLNPHVNEDIIEKRCKEPNLRTLFVASDFVLKGGTEIISAFEKLKSSSIQLTLITIRESIPKFWKKRIEKLSPIVKILEFNLKPAELAQIYAQSHVLIHPTYKDSFGLVILEAIKSGLPIIATNLYSIPEMVTIENGYVMDPPKFYFTSDKMPNPHYWKNEKDLLKDTPDKKLIKFIISSLKELETNRELLTKKSLSSWNLAQNNSFAEESIHKQWFKVYQDILS